MSPTTTFTLSPIPSIRLRDVWNFLLPILCFGAWLGAGVLCSRSLEHIVRESPALDFFGLPTMYWHYVIKSYWLLMLLTAVLFRVAGEVVPLPEEAKVRWAWGWLSLQQLSVIGLLVTFGIIGYGIATLGPIVLIIGRG